MWSANGHKARVKMCAEPNVWPFCLVRQLPNPTCSHTLKCQKPCLSVPLRPTAKTGAT